MSPAWRRSISKFRPVRRSGLTGMARRGLWDRAGTRWLWPRPGLSRRRRF